jgi:hypothetical protein
VSTQSLLKALFELIGTMTEDPAAYRLDIRKQLLEIADTMPLAPMVVHRRNVSFLCLKTSGREGDYSRHKWH